MNKGIATMEIDLVYLWVDGNDPTWLAKKKTFLGEENDESLSINCKGRYANNDELKYSLRSIEMYAPWIRKIFIVTDNQIPEWINETNTKIKIVDHKQIMPKESLPCFNSCLIEHYIHRIPELSEHFIYANDDMFINKKVLPDDFFTNNGLPIIRLTKKPFRKLRWNWRERFCKNKLEYYRKTIHKSSLLVENKYGTYYTGLPHHNIDAYLKSDFYQIVEFDFHNELIANNNNHIRNDNDIPRFIVSYGAIAKKRGKIRYVTKKESLHIKIHKKNLFYELNKKQPMFFCLNDTEHAKDHDRDMIKNYLEERFPHKSEFEK